MIDELTPPIVIAPITDELTPPTLAPSSVATRVASVGSEGRPSRCKEMASEAKPTLSAILRRKSSTVSCAKRLVADGEAPPFAANDQLRTDLRPLHARKLSAKQPCVPLLPKSCVSFRPHGHLTPTQVSADPCAFRDAGVREVYGLPFMLNSRLAANSRCKPKPLVMRSGSKTKP